MKYMIVDGELGGTGIRDKYDGGYLMPLEIGLGSAIVDLLTQWLIKYQGEHYNGFANTNAIEELDREGIEIAVLIKNELPDVKLEYFSAARMTLEVI